MSSIDTRTKITTVADAPRGRRVIAGYFDPMLPEFVERLRVRAGEGSLVVVIDTPPDAFLELRARAELAASLRFVEAVVIPDGSVQTALEVLAPAEVVSLDEEALRARFLAFVRERAKQD